MNLLQPFLDEAAARGARTAIVAADGARASYADLIAQSARLAAAWKRKGIGAGDRVLLAMPLGIPLYASLAALWRLGAVVVFPEPALGLHGLAPCGGRDQAEGRSSPSGWFRALRYRAAGRCGRCRLAISPDDVAGGGGPDRRRCGRSSGADLVHQRVDRKAQDHRAQPRLPRPPERLRRRPARAARARTRSIWSRFRCSCSPISVSASPRCCRTGTCAARTTAEPRSIAEHIATHGVTRALVPPSICEKLARGAAAHSSAIFTGGGPVFPDLLERLSAQAAARRHRLGLRLDRSRADRASARARHRRGGLASDARRRRAACRTSDRRDPTCRILDDEIVVTGDHVNKGYLDPADDHPTKLALDGDDLAPHRRRRPAR